MLMSGRCLGSGLLLQGLQAVVFCYRLASASMSSWGNHMIVYMLVADDLHHVPYESPFI